MAFFSASGSRLRHLRHLSTTSTPLPHHPVPRAQLRRLARAGRFADIDALLTPHLASHPAAVLSSFSASGMLDRASQALSSLPSPSPSLLNALLLPLLRRRSHASLVPSLLSSFSPSIAPDASTYGILTKSLCLTSGADAALPLLQEMRSKNLPPSVVVFTTLIDSLYKEQRPDQAEKLWDQMVHADGLAPDVAAYNVRISYRSVHGSVGEVEELMSEMREKAGLEPDTITFNCLMTALASHGRLPEAVGVCKGLEEKGCVPNCATYRCLVAALCKGGMVAEAEEVFYDGVRRGKVPDFGTVKLLVEGLVKKGKRRAAWRVVAGLKKKFPEDFVGNWKKLEKTAGMGAEGEGDDGGEQPVAA